MILLVQDFEGFYAKIFMIFFIRNRAPIGCMSLLHPLYSHLTLSSTPLEEAAPSAFSAWQVNVPD